MQKLKKLVPLFLVLILIVVSAGCSSGSRFSGTASESAIYGTTAGTDKSTAAPEASAKAVAASTSSASKSSTSQAAVGSRKVIRSAALSLETTDYDKSIAGLEKLVSNYGGFVQNSLSQGAAADAVAGDSRTASYTVRVPTDRLDAFISGVGGLGSLLSKSITGEDISDKYYDTETRLKILRDEQARIQDILSKTTKLNDIFTIEERLTEIQVQIEQLTGELQKWDSLVDLSTVTIQIREVARIKPKDTGLGAQISQVFGDSVAALGSTLRGILIALVAVLPFAVVFGLIALAVILIVRRARKRRSRKQPETTQDKEDTDK